jgi:protease I
MAKVVFLIDDGFEDSEFRVPLERFTAAGHDTIVVGVEAGRTVTGKRGQEHARLEQTPADCNPNEIDAVVVPGGWSPDRLRTHDDVVELVRAAGIAGKPVAAICHGPSLLLEADLVRGRRVTSWPSIRTDLVNAGAKWEDADVVCDGNVITSRRPDDLSAFCAAVLEALRAGPRRP